MKELTFEYQGLLKKPQKMVLVYKYYNLLCEKIPKAAEVSSSSGIKKKDSGSTRPSLNQK